MLDTQRSGRKAPTTEAPAAAASTPEAPTTRPAAARPATPGSAVGRSVAQAFRNSVPFAAGSAFVPAQGGAATVPPAVRAQGAGQTAAGPVAAREAAHANPVTVAVLAGDPITGQGAVAYLRTRAEVKIVSVDKQHEAEVVLVIVDTITEDTLKLMERAADASVNRDARFVLVGNGVREHHVLRAITCGLVSVIPRREADFEHVLRAITEVREGRLEMPGVALGWLVGQLRAIQQDVLEPNGLTAAGLETREVDVLRLLAEGLGTPEIAARLNYSERTVKNIIHGVLTRLKLRNRAHAVAFAVRSGAL